MSAIGSSKGYMRTGPMTEDKRRWIQKQIDGLVKANDELWRQAERIQVQRACNERQASQLTRLLEGHGS